MFRVKAITNTPTLDVSGLFKIGIATFFLTTSILFASVAFADDKRKKGYLNKKKRRRKSRAKLKKKRSERVSLGVGVILLDQDTKNIVIGLRKASHGENTWALPGGWVEKGESFVETAIREAAEETGLTQEKNFESVQVLNIAPYLNEIKIPVRRKLESGQSVVTDDKTENQSTSSQEIIRYDTFYSGTVYVIIKLKTGMKHELTVMEKEKCVEWKWCEPKSSTTQIGNLSFFPSLENLFKLDLELSNC